MSSNDTKKSGKRSARTTIGRRNKKSKSDESSTHNASTRMQATTASSPSREYNSTEVNDAALPKYLVFDTDEYFEQISFTFNITSPKPTYFHMKDNVGEGDCFFEAFRDCRPDLIPLKYRKFYPAKNHYNGCVGRLRGWIAGELKLKLFGDLSIREASAHKIDTSNTEIDQQFRNVCKSIYSIVFPVELQSGEELSFDQHMLRFIDELGIPKAHMQPNTSILMMLLFKCNVVVYMAPYKRNPEETDYIYDAYDIVQRHLEGANTRFYLDRNTLGPTAYMWHHWGGFPYDSKAYNEETPALNHFVCMSPHDKVENGTFGVKRVVCSFPWTFDFDDLKEKGYHNISDYVMGLVDARNSKYKFDDNKTNDNNQRADIDIDDMIIGVSDNFFFVLF